MKKYTLLSLFLLLSSYGFSQCAFIISANSPTYCAPATGIDITINVIGGIAPYSYQLNQGLPQAVNIFPNVAAGTYTIYVTDATPCMDSVVVTGVANPSPALSINTTTQPSCVPGCDGTATTQTVGGIGMITYSITGGAAIDVLGNGSNLCEGTIYTIVCSDANTCSGSTTVQLSMPNSPSLIISTTTQPSCVPGCDGTLTTITSGGTPVYTYAITGGAAINALGGATNLCGGIVYTVTVTDANACTGTTTVQLTTPNAPTVSILNITNATCNGLCDGSAQVMATGGVVPYSYTLIPGNIANMTGLFNNLCAGTYTIIITDANGCTATTTISISQVPGVNFTNATHTDPTCAGITDGTINVATAGGIAPISYAIFPVAGNQNPLGQFNNLPQGNYTVTASDANGCSITTTLNLAQPSLNFTINTINNLSCTCSGSIEIQNIAGGVVPFAYVISPAVNQPVPGTFDNMCGGVYTVTVTDANSCTGTSVINFNQIQLTYAGTNSQCNGVNNATINCTALYGTAPYTFTLNPGNIVNASGNFSNLSAGSYTINVVDAGLCSNTITVVRTNLTQINVNLLNIDSVICGVNGGATFTANGNAPAPYTYTVQPGNIVNANGIFNALTAGAYTLTVNNIAGCIKDDQFNIFQISGLLPVAISNNSYDESCNLAEDGAIDIIPANGNGLSYLWNTGAFTQDLIDKTAGNYFVKITNANGDCTTIYDTISVSGINCGTISGNVYMDSNSNCNFDMGDIHLQNVQVQLSNGALAFSNMSGEYQFSNVAYGNYTISQIGYADTLANNCTQPLSLSLNAGNSNIQNVDFKDSLSTTLDLSLYMYSTTYRPGIVTGPSGAWIKILPTVQYPIPFPIQTKITLILNDSLVFDHAVPVPSNITPTPAGDSLTWFVTLPPFYTINYWNTPTVQVFINTPNNYTIGTTLKSCGSVIPININDPNLNNNYKCVTRHVSNSWDPNDKSVNPIGEGPNGNITLQDSMLYYNVRFQNTGNDTALNIYILDTLSDKLDISTFNVTAFSHPYKIEILNGNILKFKFDNIMLPDSNINEPLSHGYIAYSIEQKNTNQIGDVINNTAAIYFDFNAPIITNTTVNTIATPALISSPEFEKIIKVYPNPATEKLTVEFNSNSTAQNFITLTNTLGQVLKTALANTLSGKNKIEISVKELPKGLYLLKLSNGKQQSLKKVVIE